VNRPVPHSLTTERPPQIGLIVLQADETIELEFRHLIPAEVEIFVSRVPSGEEVTPDTLAARYCQVVCGGLRRIGGCWIMPPIRQCSGPRG